MKTIIIVISLQLFIQVSFGQNSFKGCLDTLYNKLRNEQTSFNDNNILDWQNCVKGKPMPFLSLKTMSGEGINTKNLLGKIIMINLWFTTCRPCIAELPALNRLVKEYKDKDVVFLGISTDTKQMLNSDFFSKNKFDFVIIPDGMEIVNKIGQTGFPTTYIIDKKGNINNAWVGGSVGQEAETAAYLHAKPIIDTLLKAE